MQNDYNFIYDLKPHLIEDCGEYFSVYEDYKHIASFKIKELAFEYVEYRRCRLTGITPQLENGEKK